jgi:hypothetical protein
MQNLNRAILLLMILILILLMILIIILLRGYAPSKDQEQEGGATGIARGGSLR